MEETQSMRGPRKPKDLGPLHELVKRALPGFVGDADVLNVRALAKEMGVSYQAIYLMFQRGSISKRRINQICYLSKKTKPALRPETIVVDGNEVPWTPVVLDDFWPFMG